MSPAPVSIYVHVPFCEQKCAYCDFFTITDPDRKHPLAADWLGLCFQEAELLAAAGDLPPDRPVQSIFFGGGTPSLVDPARYVEFLARIRDRFALSPMLEVTLETQPGTADAATLQAYADAGITRFSIGVQTFDESTLLRTARRHTVRQAHETLRGARATGRLVSLDLICAFPGQSLEAWSQDLQQALAFSPEHISVYELTYHPGTEFHREVRKGRMIPAEDELRVEMFDHTEQSLTHAGFEHYEISNYARPGARSVHNENYWKLGDFVGLGAGAHSFLFPRRYSNPNSADHYAQAISQGRLFRRASDSSDPEIFMLENLQMALRRSEGVDLAQFGERFGGDLLQARWPRLKHLEQEGLVTLRGDTIALTREGRLRADSITEYLL